MTDSAAASDALQPLMERAGDVPWTELLGRSSDLLREGVDQSLTPSHALDATLSSNFSSWYPKLFKQTVASRIIPLEADFVDYLLSDGPLILPDSENPTNRTFKDTENDSDTDEWNNMAEDSQEDGDTSKPPSFPSLEARINKAIKQLGGYVFPKLNWSAPRDVTWVSNDSSLKCATPGDIFLLLKSSDFITHDLTRRVRKAGTETENNDTEGTNDESNGNAAVEAPSNFRFELVLRKWTEISTAMEFRCFVRGQKLIGISQRDHTNYYSMIEPIEDIIVEEITEFFNDHLKKGFNEQHYVFDVYRRGRRNILLIDINPLTTITDTLLFTWDELDPSSNSSDMPIGIAETTDNHDGAPESVRPIAISGSVESGEPQPARQTTLTDHLNKSLLNSFLDRLNTPEGGVPTFDEPEEEPFEDVDEDSDDDTPGQIVTADPVGPAPAEVAVDFRYVKSQEGIKPSVYINSRVPQDILNVQSASDIETLARMFRQNKIPDQDSDSEDDTKKQ